MSELKTFPATLQEFLLEHGTAEAAEFASTEEQEKIYKEVVQRFLGEDPDELKDEESGDESRDESGDEETAYNFEISKKIAECIAEICNEYPVSCDDDAPDGCSTEGFVLHDYTWGRPEHNRYLPALSDVSGFNYLPEWEKANAINSALDFIIKTPEFKRHFEMDSDQGFLMIKYYNHAVINVEIDTSVTPETFEYTDWMSKEKYARLMKK